MLTEEAETVLGLLQQGNPDSQAIPKHLVLLRSCRAIGIDPAYQELTSTRSTTQQTAQDPVTLALAALLQVDSLESLQAALAQHPALLELPTLAQLAALVANAQEAGQLDMARHLLTRLIILIERYHQAHTEQIDTAEQAQFVALVTVLLPLAAELDADAAAGLRRLLGWALNTLGNQYATQGDHTAAVESYSQAIVYAPDNAMLYRNRAGEHLELRQHEPAAADIEQAAILEPDAPRLADLRQMLANGADTDGED